MIAATRRETRRNVREEMRAKIRAACDLLEQVEPRAIELLAADKGERGILVVVFGSYRAALKRLGMTQDEADAIGFRGPSYKLNAAENYMWSAMWRHEINRRHCNRPKGEVA